MYLLVNSKHIGIQIFRYFKSILNVFLNEIFHLKLHGSIQLYADDMATYTT